MDNGGIAAMSTVHRPIRTGAPNRMAPPGPQHLLGRPAGLPGVDAGLADGRATVIRRHDDGRLEDGPGLLRAGMGIARITKHIAA